MVIDHKCLVAPFHVLRMKFSGTSSNHTYYLERLTILYPLRIKVPWLVDLRVSLQLATTRGIAEFFGYP